MLTVEQTINSIFNRLLRRASLSKFIYIAARDHNFVVFAVNCFSGSEQKTLGRYVISQIRAMNLHNKPSKYGFSSTFVKPKNGEAIICSPSEVLIELSWN